MNNRTVECVYDDGTETVIGSAVLKLTVGKLYMYINKHGA